jgi:outer membrane protein assembly factor BamB
MNTTARVLRTCVRRRMDCTSLAFGLLGLIGVAGTALAGCGPSPTPPARTQQAPALYFMLDANALAAKSNSDLRFSVVALDTHDGHIAWRHRLETPSPTDSTTAALRPLLEDGLVYASYYYTDQQTQTYHGVVETLDPATGTTRWRSEVATEIENEPVVSGSMVYVTASVIPHPVPELGPTSSGLVVALDRQTGTVRWQRALDDRLSLPAVTNGQVFVMVSQQFGGHLLALNASDGSVMWDHTFDVGLAIGDDTKNGGSTAPLVRNHLIYVQASSRDASGIAHLALLALNTRDGSVAWRYQTGGSTATPVFNQSGDTLCVSSYPSPPLGGTSVVAGLAALSGRVRWRVTDVSIPSGCSSQGDVFYLTEGSLSQPGSVLALNSQDGRQLWRIPTASQVVGDAWRGPTVTQGFVGVYLVGPGTPSTPVRGRMVVLRAGDGKLLWQGDFDGEPGGPMDIEGDQIYNPEVAAGLPIVVVYALDSGARLWSYGFGHL